MAHPLLDLRTTDQSLDDLLCELPTPFRSFLHQDSHCLALGVELQGRRFFLKYASDPRGMASLRRAKDLHARVRHPAIAPLLNSFECRDGLVLVYPWLPGETLYHHDASPGGQPDRKDPSGPHARFRALPRPRIEVALGVLFEAHVEVETAGYVAVDFYDGCFHYDFEAHQMHLIDLDEYRLGPFVLDVERLPGSSRFMAPEEFRRGATIDHRTTVFHLGRSAALLLDEGDNEGLFRGCSRQGEVVERATREDPDERYGSVEAFFSEWRRATPPGTP